MEKVFQKMSTKNDDIFTRKVDADKLAKYLIKYNIVDLNAKIWLPFNDKKANNIYLALKEVGFKNLITTDTDFYTTKIDYDIIISNPPFSGRSKLFKHLMELDKPFILLQPIMFFNNGTCIQILIKNGAKFGGVCPNGRIGFLFPKNSMGFVVNGVEKEKTTAFYSFWLCFKTKINGFVSLEE